MKPIKVTLTAIFLTGFVTLLHAQQATVSSGGNASGSTGYLNFTIGQMVFTSDNGNNGSVSKGIQLPYEFFKVGIAEIKGISLQCVVYPNPTNSDIKLMVENFRDENLRFELYDMRGNQLQNQKVTGSETIITMNNLLPALYFLKVIEDNTEVTSFKVIKNY
jgi:hypothetical protein